MIRFAVVGTNWITERFIDAAHESGKLKLSAVYSRSLEQAQAFGANYQVTQFYDSLEAMAQSDAIDAVYIASPNSLHCPQSLLFLRHKKHVICEKPLASNQREAEQVVACARENQVVLFEAFKSAYLPNFLALQQALPKIGRLRKAFINYCQYSSRYPRYLAGENPNTFNPQFSNGSIMDIGYYCLASAVALFGAPQSVLASATLLDTGVDAHGTVCLNYGDFDVTLSHSKVSDSAIPSEIQGEEGTLIIDKISECQGVALTPRGGNRQDLSQPQHINTMLYEALAFAELVEKRQVEHPGLENSLIVARLLTDIRRQTGVVFLPTENEMKPLLVMQTGDAPQAIRQELANFEGMFLQQGNIDAERAHTVHLPAGERPLPPAAYCGVVITGSPAMVTERLPWSEEAAEWLRQAMAIKLPLFGVCYGHQLLAYALGGEVGYHPQGMEVGTLEIELLPAAAADRRPTLLPPRFKANLIHSQSVLTPPAGAQTLARSQQDAHQILRYGDHALTTQFHPEFNGAVMSQYLQWLGELHPEQQARYHQQQQQVSDTPFSRLLLQGFVVSLGAQKAMAG